MAEPDNIVLEHLKRIRAVVEHTNEELSDLKLRMSAVEQGLANVAIQIGQLQLSMSSFQRRADRLDTRSDSVEVRLDRLETTTGQRLARIEEKLGLTDA